MKDMKFYLSIVFSVLFLAVIDNASAQSSSSASSVSQTVKIQLAWVAPTEYVDNTPLPASAIGGYTLRYKKGDGAWSSVNVPVPSNSYILTIDANAKYAFQVNCYTISGLNSTFADFTFTSVSLPNSPKGLSVKIIK